MTAHSSRRPDARLIQLHAERGDPQARLGAALAALEDADWGLLLSGEAALARQLAALLGPGTLRVDGRLNVSRAALAEAGLAAADLHGDLTGARAVWVLEPERATLDRARRAGVPVIVDATLAPGGGWPRQGADYVVYRDGVTLSGFADAPLAALFGTGEAPEPAAPPPSDLAVALALRDVATLPLRLARAARTVSQLSERLGDQVRPAGPTALLLLPEQAADTVTPLGGLLAAARHVPEGLLLTPGLEDADAALALLRSPGTPKGARQEPESRDERRGGGREGRREFGGRDSGSRDSGGRDGPAREGGHQGFRPRDERRGPPGGRGSERPAPARLFQGDRPDQPNQPGQYSQPNRPDRAQRPESSGRFQAGAAPQSGGGRAEPARVVFEAPPAPPVQAGAPADAEPAWEPEIVFSDLSHPPVPLTHTVSSGPDAAPAPHGEPQPPLGEPAAEARPTAGEAAPDDAFPSGALSAEPEAAPEPDASAEAPAEEASPPAETLAPDLPSVADDPASGLTGEQAAIYARLREWRNAEAKRQEISRFIVASNATLAEIARRVPYTTEDLRAVRGMGPGRLDKYGDKILEVVRG